LYKVSGDEYRLWNSWKNQLIGIGFLTLNHQQLLSIINNVNVELDFNVHVYFSFWSFTENVLSVFKVECTGYGDFTSGMIVKSFGPIYFFAVTFLVALVSRFVAKCVNQALLAMDLDRCVNLYFSLILTFFVGVASMALSLFKCVKSPNGVYTMKQDPAVNCYEGTWNSLLVVGIFSVLLYCIGSVAMFTYIICTAPYYFSDIHYQRRWKFLFIKFRPDAHYWALVIMARGLATNIGFVFFTFGLAQLYWILACESTYMGLTIFAMPWRFVKSNYLCIFASISVIYACALNALWVEQDGVLRKDVSLMIIVVTSCPVALALILCIYVAITRRIWSDWSGEKARREVCSSQFTQIQNECRRVSALNSEVGKNLYCDAAEWDAHFLKASSQLIPAVFFAQQKSMSRLISSGCVLDTFNESGIQTTLEELSSEENVPGTETKKVMSRSGFEYSNGKDHDLSSSGISESSTYHTSNGASKHSVFDSTTQTRDPQDEIWLVPHEPAIDHLIATPRERTSGISMSPRSPREGYMSPRTPMEGAFSPRSPRSPPASPRETV
jgi:hypothetical protein